MQMRAGKHNEETATPESVDADESPDGSDGKLAFAISTNGAARERRCWAAALAASSASKLVQNWM